MNPLDRRSAVRVLAAGTACAATSVLPAAVPAAAPSSPARTPTGPDAGAVGPARALHTAYATVHHCRSFASEVLLAFEGGLHGFVQLDARGFAIAAACQAVGRRVAAQVWGHDPTAGAGDGRFAGARLAFAVDDLLTVEDLA